MARTKRNKRMRRKTIKRKGGRTQDPDIIYLENRMKYYNSQVKNQPNQIAHMRFRADNSRNICAALARLREKGYIPKFPGYNSPDSCTEKAIEFDESQDM